MAEVGRILQQKRKNLSDLHVYLDTLDVSDDTKVVVKGSICAAQAEMGKELDDIDFDAYELLETHLLGVFGKAEREHKGGE